MNARIVEQSTLPSEAVRKMLAKAQRSELEQSIDYLRAAAHRFRMAGRPALRMRVEALLREAQLELSKV